MKYHVASSVSLYDFLKNNNIPNAQKFHIHPQFRCEWSITKKIVYTMFFGEIVRKHFVKSKIESGTIKLDISGTKEDFFFFGFRLYMR